MEYILNLSLGRAKSVWKDGREYLVGTVSSINPGILHGSEGALLYPEDQIKNSVAAWNGMPLTIYHPEINGQAASAQDPGVLPRQGAGYIKDSVFNGKLRHEYWLDVEKANRIDNGLPEHIRVVPRIRAGKQVEVSTGLYTENEDNINGDTWNGQYYNAVAKNYRPDHLAILPDQVGACSNNDGCGMNVVNQGTKPMDNILTNFISWLTRNVGLRTNASITRGDGSIDNPSYPQRGGMGGGGLGTGGGSKEEIEERDKDTIDEEERVAQNKETQSLWITYNAKWTQDKRDKLQEKNFAGPHKSFPIKDQKDVEDAARLIGHADNPDEVKSRIKSIAKRKGLSLPESWESETHNLDRHQTSGRFLADGGPSGMGNVSAAAKEGRKDGVTNPNIGKGKGRLDTSKQDTDKLDETERDANQVTDVDGDLEGGDKTGKSGSPIILKNQYSMGPEAMPHEASKTACASSMMAEHPEARSMALQAVDASKEGMPKEAAGFHKKAAMMHERAATDARKEEDMGDADMHDNSAALHRKAASMHSAMINNESSSDKPNRGNGMAKIMINRKTILGRLVKNCTCSKTKTAYGMLPTKTLAGIARNAKMMKDEEEAQEEEDEGEGDEIDKIENEESEIGEFGGAVDSGGYDKNPDNKVAPQLKGGKVEKKGIQNYLAEHGTPEEQQAWNNVMVANKQMKINLIKRLIAHVPVENKDLRRRLIVNHQKKSIQQLQDEIAALPIMNQSRHQPRIYNSEDADMLGIDTSFAPGGDIVGNQQTNNARTEEDADLIGAPTINWRETDLDKAVS